MKTTRFVSLTALVALALAAAASHASDAATTKLLDCMKLEAASPRQQACLSEVQTLGSAPKPAAAAMQARAAAAMQAPAATAARKPLPAPATLAKVQLATGPPQVRQAIAGQQL